MSGITRSRVFVATLIASFAFFARADIPTNYPVGPGPMNINVGADGKLLYQPDTNGDTIPDISNCGYMGGGVPIPTNVPVVLTLNPVGGDNLAQIQNAITNVGNMPIQANGFRGAILLKAGLYPVSNKVTLFKSGVILRGEGSGANGTILQMTGGNVTILNMDNGGSGASQVSNTQHNITDAYVPVGAKWFHVDSTNGWKIGDTIKVVRVCTANWLAIINQTNWSASAFYVKWDRIITDMSSNRIAIDAPITQGIDTNYGGGYVYKYTFTSRLTNCAFEDIRGICSTGVDTNGNTDGNFLTLNNVMNCWVRRCLNDKMRGHSSDVTGDSKWVTFEDLASYHTYVPNHSGSSIQINTYNGLSLALYHRVTTSDAGFEFSSGGLTPGPNAIVECDIPHGFAATSPHMKWALATFYDDLYMNQTISVQDQGLNSSHGWAGANQIAWNVETASSINFDRPQTAHQMIIGGIGSFGGNRTGTLPPEIISKNAHVMPRCLYRQQLTERLGGAAALAALGAPYGDNYFVLNLATNTQAVTPGLSVTNILQMTVKATTPYTNLSMYPANFYTNYPGTNVSFSVSGLPPGATAVFNPPTLNTNGTTSLTITTTGATPGGSYPLVVKGTGNFKTLAGGTSVLTNYATLTLNVANVANFSMAATPQSQTVIAAASTNFSVTVTASNGFSGAVALSVNGLPPNTSASFSPPSVTGSGISTLTITTSNNTPLDSYALSIVGTGGGSSAAASVQFSVAPAPGTLPSPWTDTDLGTPAISGEGTFSNGTFIVQGAGADTGGTADEGHFVYQPFSQDMVISAHVANEQNTDPSAKAGVMIRATTDANSVFVDVVATPGNGVLMEYRPSTGVSAVDVAGPGLSAPCWVKLVRSANSFTGYASPDGTNWTAIASTNIVMSDPVSAGMVVCSHNPAQLNTSLIDNVSLVGPDFVLLVAPNSQSVNAGLNGDYTINIVPTNGFSGTVTLSEDDDLTPDAGATLSTNVITVPGSATLNFSTTTATPQDTYTLNLTAISGAMSHSTAVTLNVASLLPAGLWTGASGDDVLWSDGENWGNGLPPGTGDNVKFYNLGATNLAGAIDDIVDSDTTIASLQFGNTNGFHTMQIAAGATLTVVGSTGANGYALFAGTASDNGSNQTLNAVITGSGGALAVSNSAASVNFGQGAAVPFAQRATLDMSGLDTFSATLNNFYIGNQPSNTTNNPGRQTATVYLAKTNLITLASAGSFLISQAASDGTTTGNSLYLGESNAFFGNTVITSGGKGGVGNALQFNPAFAGANPFASFRGVAGGTNRVSLWAVGYATSSSANNDSIGTNDFTGGAVDVLVDTMIIGRGQAANNGGRGGNGTLTFNAGVFNVNTLEVGFQVSGDSSYGTGMLNVNNSGTLIVNNALGLGFVGASPNANTRGALNIHGGTAWLNMLTNGGSGASSVTITGGTLGITNSIGMPAAPIPNFSLTNSTLRLQLDANVAATNVVVSNLTANGANIVAIDLIQNVSSPATFALFSYANLTGSVGANFSLTLPSGFTGSLVDNAAQKRIDLNVNIAPVTQPVISSISLSGGNMLMNGSNGPFNHNFYVLASSNVSLPLSNWTPISTNSFSAGGAFNVTNPLPPGAGQQFYLLQVP
jgi:hypothetical protein